MTHGYKKFDKKRPFPALCVAQFAFRKANEETQLENIREFSKDCLPWDMLWTVDVEWNCCVRIWCTFNPRTAFWGPLGPPTMLTIDNFIIGLNRFLKTHIKD